MARTFATACPDWCAGGHHCTAQLGSGTHASTPEVWHTETGRVVATRHLRGRRGWLELRISIPLPDGDETMVVGLMRLLLVGAHRAIAKILGRAKDLAQ